MRERVPYYVSEPYGERESAMSAERATMNESAIDDERATPHESAIE
jgi:hypothetical protein